MTAHQSRMGEISIGMEARKKSTQSSVMEIDSKSVGSGLDSLVRHVCF